MIRCRRRAASASQMLERSRSGCCSNVQELQVLNDELDVGQTSRPALQVVPRPRGLELAPHRQNLRRPARLDRPRRSSSDRIASVTCSPNPPVAKITRARVRLIRSQVWPVCR